MPLQQWPKRDREIWSLATTATSPFSDDGGERAALRPHSNRRLQSSYGRWLSFLQGAGHLTAPGDPASRISRNTVEQYVGELQSLGNMPSTIALRLTDLLLMARLFKPQENWSFIGSLASKVRALPTVKRDKRSRLRGTDELYDLGLQLISQSPQAAAPVDAATLYRDGLIIALLALVPLRGSNFVQIRIETELVRADSGWRVALAAHQTKTHAPLEFDWPRDLVGPLETYIRDHRPLLALRRYRWLARAADHLWVAQSGSALTQVGFYSIVRKRTKAAFGLAINPHAFRDAAATTIAIHDPEHARIAAPVLGHRSLSTTEKFYNQAQSLDAHRRYSKALDIWRSSPKVPT
jgi:integrase